MGDRARPAAGGWKITLLAGLVGIAIGAGAVLLADGGFQNNAEMVRRHISPRPEALVARSSGTGRGSAVSRGFMPRDCRLGRAAEAVTIPAADAPVR